MLHKLDNYLSRKPLGSNTLGRVYCSLYAGWFGLTMPHRYPGYIYKPNHITRTWDCMVDEWYCTKEDS